MTQALVVSTAQSADLQPGSVDEALRLSKILVASKLLPRGVGSPEAAFAIILAGRELGLSPMQALRSIHIIEGKPTMSADLMLALVKRSPRCRYFKMVESTEKAATYETDREGEGPTRMSFTLDEAKAASLTGKDNWRKFPSAMLRARCIAALARTVYPDVLLGVYETDELEPSHLRMAPEAPRAAEPQKDDYALQPGHMFDLDYEELALSIAQAPSLDILGDVAVHVKLSTSLSEHQKNALRAAYKARKAELAPEELPTPSPAPVAVETKPVDDESTVLRHALLIRLDACSTVAGVSRLTEEARERQEAGVLSEEDLRVVFDAAKAVGERIAREESHYKHHGDGRYES
jgi:hypothetical protein